VYPLACLLAVAVCAFTAAGHDRLTAIGQWIARASQEDLARLGSPVDPWTGLRRVPDESTIRHVLGEVDPASLSRALLGPKRRSLTGKGADGSPSHSVREYPARRRKDALAKASVRLRAMAIDGKTSRGARRGDGTRVHLLGVAGHDGHFIDQVEVDIKSNETTSFTPLLDPLDLTGAVTTFDAMHTVRANLDWLVTAKNAHYIAVVKKNQPLLYERLRHLPWKDVPVGDTTRDRGHGRYETRSLKAAHVTGLDFPHARQAIKITRWRQLSKAGKASRETVYAVTDLTSANARPAELAHLVREHWSIENRSHHVRDVTFTEDACTSRTGHCPVNLATIRCAVINAIRSAGYQYIPEGRRDHMSPSQALRLHGLN
jgi:predicted transposase YbfD/YdcC